MAHPMKEGVLPTEPSTQPERNASPFPSLMLSHLEHAGCVPGEWYTATYAQDVGWQILHQEQGLPRLLDENGEPVREPLQ